MYHTTPEGRTLPCRNPDKCPYGACVTQEASQKAYEASMASKTTMGMSRTNSKGRTQKELNEWAKNSTNVDELQQVAEQGKERALRNLAANEHATSEQLLLGRNRTNNPETKEKFERADNFPVEDMSEELLRHLLRHNYGNQLEQRNGLNDAGVDRIMAMGARALPIAANRYNQVSAAKLQELTSGMSSTDIGYVMRCNPRYSPKDIDSMSTNELIAIGRESNDAETLHRIATVLINKTTDRELETAAEQILMNRNVSDKTLNMLVQHPGIRNENNFVNIFSHPNASNVTKQIAAKRDRRVASIVKIKDLVADKPETIKRIQDTTHYESDYRKCRYRFDPDVLKEVGWGDYDVDTYVRYELRNYLWGPQYNLATGEYIGYTD